MPNNRAMWVQVDQELKLLKYPIINCFFIYDKKLKVKLLNKAKYIISLYNKADIYNFTEQIEQLYKLLPIYWEVIFPWENKL
jgi:hypothetical protein